MAKRDIQVQEAYITPNRQDQKYNVNFPHDNTKYTWQRMCI